MHHIACIPCRLFVCDKYRLFRHAHTPSAHDQQVVGHVWLTHTLEDLTSALELKPDPGGGSKLGIQASETPGSGIHVIPALWVCAGINDGWGVGVRGGGYWVGGVSGRNIDPPSGITNNLYTIEKGMGLFLVAYYATLWDICAGYEWDKVQRSYILYDLLVLWSWFKEGALTNIESSLTYYIEYHIICSQVWYSFKNM